MISRNIKYLFYILIFIITGIIYLSYFGIETKRFNYLIEDKILQNNKKLKIELQDVKIILNLRDFSFNLKTLNTNLFFENKEVKIEEIKTNLSIISYFNDEFSIKDLLISTKANNIKDIISLIRSYKNSPELFILNKITKSGNIVAKIKHFLPV